MAILARPRFLAISFSVFISLVGIPSDAPAQETLGSIVGRVRVVRGDAPPKRVLVTLELHSTPVDSVYTDSQGTYGFHSLHPEIYSVSINDEQYQPVELVGEIRGTSLSPTVYLDFQLTPKKEAGSATQDSRQQGSNPNMMDIRDYNQNFPRPAVKEFEKGLRADAEGKTDSAIRHYQKAIAIAPDFYLAHNNLGSDYVSKSSFADARGEFEKVVQLNQSDAAAYFNLSNVCMLTGQMPQAQEFLDDGLRRQPDSALGQFLLGSLDLRLNKPVLAEAALQRAIQLDPTKAQYRLQLVNLLLQQGRKDAAAGQLRDFLDKLPDSPFSVQAKQVLQKLETPSKRPTTN